MPCRFTRFVLLSVVVACGVVAAPCGFALQVAVRAEDRPTPDFTTDVAPLLAKYCTACHNPKEHEGKLSLESFADLQRGGEHGPAVLPGEGQASRMIRLLTGEADPRMPPEGNEAPTAEEIAVLRAWIDGGAKGPEGAAPDRRQLLTPKLPPAEGVLPPVTALAWSPDGKSLAVARFGEIEIQDAGEGPRTLRTLSGHAGKVNSIEFSADGKLLVAASGVSGLYGQAVLWDATSGEKLREISDHRDTLYSAVLSPDGRLFATAGYDRTIVLWDAASGDRVRELTGHNGAVYDLAFSPDGAVLASASGDETIKLWRVADGARLDTLGQPEGEQYVVAFSPDGRYVLAGGVDNRLRVWRFVSRDKPDINPLTYSRFAHEGPVVNLGFSADGAVLVSVGEDRTVKLWDLATFSPLKAYDQQPDVASALAVSPAGDAFVLGRMDGTLGKYAIERGPAAGSDVVPAAPVTIPAAAAMNETAEIEPNNEPAAAQAITLPAIVSGAIHASGDGRLEDFDLFRFDATAGQQWILEVDAARSQSPLDSKIEVLATDGQPVPRLLLRAVRDSYITFRGIDSATRDCRVHNWEEMELNELLYLNGEVVKLYRAPRGPDSGFLFYPHDGSRRCLFDTSALAHALQEPCYVVEPHAPGTTLVPNGLPVFPLYYENDDDGERRLGGDSRLTFTAPSDGTYLVRVRDVRGAQGEQFKYKLTIRPPRPDFVVTLNGANPAVAAGSGREFNLVLQRVDGFDGEVRIDISGLPPGFQVTTPLTFEPGHEIVRGVITAAANAPLPTQEAAKAAQVTATANVGGEVVTKVLNNLGEIKLTEKPQLIVKIAPDAPQHVVVPDAANPAFQHAPLVADGGAADDARRLLMEPLDADAPLPNFDYPRPLELVIAPGETITAKVLIERNNFTERVTFGGEPGSNLPHGVIVDNIGLNGLLITPDSSERVFFLSAAKWTPESTRTFHLVTDQAGNQASTPVILHVRKRTTP